MPQKIKCMPQSQDNASDITEKFTIKVVNLPEYKKTVKNWNMEHTWHIHNNKRVRFMETTQHKLKNTAQRNTYKGTRLPKFEGCGAMLPVQCYPEQCYPVCGYPKSNCRTPLEDRLSDSAPHATRIVHTTKHGKKENKPHKREYDQQTSGQTGGTETRHRKI